MKLSKISTSLLVSGVTLMTLAPMFGGMTGSVSAATAWTARSVNAIQQDLKTTGIDKYTIKWGDTLSTISAAAKKNGVDVSVKRLAEINHINNVDLIETGNTLLFKWNGVNSTVTVKDQDGNNNTYNLDSNQPVKNNDSVVVTKPSTPNIGGTTTTKPTTPDTNTESNSSSSNGDNTNNNSNSNNNNGAGNSDNNSNNGNSDNTETVSYNVYAMVPSGTQDEEDGSVSVKPAIITKIGTYTGKAGDTVSYTNKISHGFNDGHPENTFDDYGNPGYNTYDENGKQTAHIQKNFCRGIIHNHENLTTTMNYDQSIAALNDSLTLEAGQTNNIYLVLQGFAM